MKGLLALILAPILLWLLFKMFYDISYSSLTLLELLLKRDREKRKY